MDAVNPLHSDFWIVDDVVVFCKCGASTIF